jgi:hypothetical protein
MPQLWMGGVMTDLTPSATEARKLARALHNTTQSYRAGLMSHATWKSHMASLWGTVDAKGLRTAVTFEVGQLTAEEGRAS